MLSVSSVLVAALLASSTFAGPVAPRASKKHVTFKKHGHKAHPSHVAAHDHARASRLTNKHKPGKRQIEDVGATNTVTSYLASVQIGNPPTTYNLIIDTGSSNTWVGANTQFQSTSTSQDSGQSVSVSYGSGSFSGELFTDQVALSGDLVVTQPIGVASQATGFNGVDGILGIGPTGLTDGTVSGGGTIPTIMDTLVSSGLIHDEVIGVSFEPATEQEDPNGTLTFGGVDTSQFTGDITFVPITTTAPASNFWGIDSEISYNGQTILGSSGIVDTGTTLILLATDAFQAYMQATGAVQDPQSGLLTVTQDQFNQMSDLNFVVGGTTFALPPNGQLFPGASSNPDAMGLVVGDLGNQSGSGLDFIAGQSFLERFYSVYDSRGQIGLAYTQFTNATTN